MQPMLDVLLSSVRMRFEPADCILTEKLTEDEEVELIQLAEKEVGLMEPAQELLELVEEEAVLKEYEVLAEKTGLLEAEMTEASLMKPALIELEEAVLKETGLMEP